MTDSSASVDPCEAEWLARESVALKKGQCPYTSERLVTWGNVQIPAGTLSCSMCDCFGYRPDEVGK